VEVAFQLAGEVSARMENTVLIPRVRNRRAVLALWETGCVVWEVGLRDTYSSVDCRDEGGVFGFFA
jgi:hypothetical protein